MARIADPSIRDKLLRAALALFAERGFHGVAVPEIARRAGVATGSVYRHFASKEALVNAVFVAAKSLLKEHLGDDWGHDEASRAMFNRLWERLVSFACSYPTEFHFLEMQDHNPYLEEESRQIELQVLAPIWLFAHRIARDEGRSFLRPEVMMAAIWGALVGVFKEAELGYFAVTEPDLDALRDRLYLMAFGV